MNLEGTEFPVIRDLLIGSDILKTFQSLNHFIFPNTSRTSLIGSVFSISREGHKDQRCENSKQHLKEKDGQHIPPTGSFSLIFKYIRIHDMSDNPSEENHEGIEDSLEEGHRDHISGKYMAHFMGDDTLDLRWGHGTQESGRYGHQGAIFGRSCRECVWIITLIYANFRHIDTILTSDLHDYRVHQLWFRIIIHESRFREELYLIHSFRHPARDREAQKWSHEPEDKGKNEKPTISTGETRGDSNMKKSLKHENNDRNNENNCDIGRKKQENTFKEIHIKNGLYIRKVLPYR